MNILKKFKLKRNQNFYDMVPKRKFEHKLNSNGKVEIIIPRFDDNFIGRLISKQSSKENIKAELDEIGTIVWLAIDGKNTVFDISKKLKEKIDDQKQVEERTVEYLKHLYDSSFVDFEYK